MGNTEFIAFKDINSIIRDTIKEVNESMSLLCDDLIKEAEKCTTTKGEYNAFMKGAAFIFYNIAKRNKPQQYGTPSTINSIEDAIEHIIKLLPFMEESEKNEHLILIGWLNELLELKGRKTIKIPEQFDVKETLDALNSRVHRHEDENMRSVKTTAF